MSEVKVLVQGIHEKNNKGELNIGSTTTLIKSNINIIVDPGAYINKDKLLESLQNEGLKPADIDAVILTHSHLDHTINTFLFPQAKVYTRFISGDYPGQFHKIDEGYVKRFDLLNESIAEDIQILDTAGHSIDHISVLVETGIGKVIIAGDAVANESFVDKNKQPDLINIYSIEKYNESREKILEVADYIVPGHGPMFKLEK